MNPWYNKLKTSVNYSTIHFKNLKILIGARPDLWGVTKNFAQKINIWISLLDIKYKCPPWNPQMYSYPLTNPPWKKTSFICIKEILDKELQKNKQCTIYIHCELGQIRSPIMIFHWLLSHISKEDARKIFKEKPNVYLKYDNFYHAYFEK